jgi:DNA repair protein RadC
MYSKTKLRMKALSQNVAEISVTYKVTDRHKPTVCTSADAYNELIQWFPEDIIGLQEMFVVAYLNRSNRIVGVYQVSKGGITGTVADPRLILATGLKIAATGMILAHNHPSGSLKPSKQDEDLTRKIKQAALLLDMQVLDHIIVNPQGHFFSFADEGNL